MTAPVGQYVLKVHGRCDLACDHCYVYEHADQSWRGKPARMSRAVVARAAERIAEHAERHRLDDVLVILHGGEPLLLGVAGMRAVLRTLRARLAPETVRLRVHTNGVRLDRRFCAVFSEYEVGVGVSLDGDREANDRHRRYADGRSSHPAVLRALALLREERESYAGILCTVDLANDPIAVYEALLAQGAPALDLLLPHATWDGPPERPAGSATPYAAWLGAIYARWIAGGRPVPIRLFDSILSAARGGPSWTEAIGTEPVDLLVVETDGRWEQADSLKTAFDGAPATGMDVFTHAVDDVVAHPGVAARMKGKDGLCAACRACDVVDICGGGLYAHRYRSGSGFDNPSVYCADLKALIRHMVPAAPAPARSYGPRPGEDADGLSDTALESLGRGSGASAAVAELAEHQVSVTRMFTAQVAADAGGGDRELARIAAEAWALLCELDETRPGAVRTVMAHPYVRAWAVDCLRRSPDGQVRLDRAHLAGLALAAARHAGEPAELRVPVRDGWLHLPTLGAFEVGDAGSSVPVRVSPDGIVTAPAAPWSAARRFVSGHLDLLVEDLDPFRRRHRWPVTGRLPLPAWRAWRRLLDATVHDLRRRLPGLTGEVEAGLRSIVPMTGHAEPASHRDTPGAVALGPATGERALGEALVGGFHGAKFDALSEVIDLCEPGSAVTVPWSTGSWPIKKIVRTAYGDLGRAEFWRAHESRERFRAHRTRLARALDVLAESDALTGQGVRFVTGMAATEGGWDAA